jgi:hypothetical protein
MSSQYRSPSQKGFALALFFVIAGYAGMIPASIAGEREDRTRQLLFTQRDYYNHGNEIDDLSLYLGMYADDAVAVSPAGTRRGIEEIKEYYANSLKTWKAKVTYKRGVVEGNTIALEFTWVATHRASGRIIELDMVGFVEFNDDGRRISQSMYYDTAKAAKFLEEVNAGPRQ